MSCPHSMRSDASPSTCSMCLAAPVRRVAQSGAEMVVGEMRRPIDRETSYSAHYYGKRGGRALHGSKTR